MRHVCIWLYHVRGKDDQDRPLAVVVGAAIAHVVLPAKVYTGGPPFQGNNPTVRSQALLSGRRPRRPTDPRIHELGLDDDMWMFIESLWAHRPEARLVAESARDFLRYKSSAVVGQGGSRRAQDDPEWDTGFLSSLVVAKDVFML